MPVILLVCVAITVLIAIRANRIAADQAIADADRQEASSAISFEAAAARLQQDAYPEINALISRYFDAYVSGDVTILNSGLYRTLDEIETVTLEERAKYVEEVANLTVYTKPGPVEDSWIAYAYTDVRYIGCDEFLPAALSLYICRDEDGTYYINADESAQSVKDYIRAVNLQDDVVDLYNRINVAYAEKLEENPMMSELVAAIYAEIDESVGERLVGAEAAIEEAAGAEAAVAGTSGQTETGSESAVTATSAEPETPKEVKIRAITTVNVRKSDSTEAEVLGKAQEGEEYVRISEQGNGWSKISFAGSAAYVKSEYFEVVDAGEAADASAGGGATVASEASTSAAGTSSSATAGTTAGTGASTGATAGAGASTGASAAASTKASTSSSAASTRASAAASTAGTGATTASTGATATISGTGTKTVSTGVRLRKEPSTEADILTTLYGGAKVTVKKIRDDGWSEVEYNGTKGYIKTEFLQD